MSKNSGEKAYSVDKFQYVMQMIIGALLTYGGYGLLTASFVFFLLILHITDLNNEYVNQNVFIRPVYQFLRSTKIFQSYFPEISAEKYFKSVLVFFYTIIFVLLIRDMMNLQLYYHVYSTIQMNPENNPKKDPTLITKSPYSPFKDTTTYIVRMITSLIMIFLYPFLVLYVIRCYDPKNNVATQLALLSIVFVPLFYYLVTYTANMRQMYKAPSLLQYGKKYIEEKDYAWIDRMEKNYTFQFNTVLWVPLFIAFLSIFYFVMHYSLQQTGTTEVQFVLVILFLIIPLTIMILNYNVIFQCYDDNNLCGIFRKGLIKYEVYHNGIKTFYDALVKYNYLCFPK